MNQSFLLALATLVLVLLLALKRVKRNQVSLDPELRERIVLHDVLAVSGSGKFILIEVGGELQLFAAQRNGITYLCTPPSNFIRPDSSELLAMDRESWDC